MIKFTAALKNCLTLMLLLSLSLLMTACHQEESAQAQVVRPVKTVTVTDPLKSSLRRFPGRISANQDASLSFEVPEKLIEFPVSEGEFVDKAQLIARLDPAIYQDRVNEAEAKKSLAQAQFERAKKLLVNGHISQADYDIFEAKYKIQQADLSTARRDLASTYLHAPFSGIIAKKHVENFEYVNAKQEIVNLHDISYVDVEIYVPEYIMINLKGDQDADIHVVFDSFPNEKFPITFKEFSSQAEQATQTYRVVFSMRAPEVMTVLPGMSVTVEAMIPDYTSLSGKFYLIPAGAVFTDENKQTFVWLVDPDTFTIEKTPVQIGNMIEDQIRVTSGIEPGDRIVTAGVHFLRAGDEVSISEQNIEE